MWDGKVWTRYSIFGLRSPHSKGSGTKHLPPEFPQDILASGGCSNTHQYQALQLKALFQWTLGVGSMSFQVSGRKTTVCTKYQFLGEGRAYASKGTRVYQVLILRMTVILDGCERTGGQKWSPGSEPERWDVIIFLCKPRLITSLCTWNPSQMSVSDFITVSSDFKPYVWTLGYRE